MTITIRLNFYQLVGDLHPKLSNSASLIVIADNKFGEKPI